MTKTQPPLNAFSKSARASLDPKEFEHFSKFLRDACGITLAENKQYLVTTRIRRILTEHNLDCLLELVERMRQSRYAKLREQVIDAMTTNETFWFRDKYPYDYLYSHLLPELQEQRATGPIRIWSAACSSGQEPYSMSMVVEEYKRGNMGAASRQVEIIATDLSASMLEQARKGEYDKMAILRGLSDDRLAQFFDAQPNELWRVKPFVGDRIQFRPMNLMDPYISLGKLDIIFCRNVLIYFSVELKQDILRRMHAALKPNGVLVLGSSEGLAGVSDLFEMVHCKPGIVYRAL